MEIPMNSWNDDRLDELNARVGHGFKAVDKRFEQVDKRFDQVDKRFDRVESEIKALRTEVKGEIGELRGDIKGMQRLMVQGFVAFCAVMVSGFFALAGLTAF